MKQCRITVMRVARYDDLIAQYENPIQHACDMTEGQVFLANGWEKPAGFCQSAWDTLSPFVLALSHGAEGFYDGWMKNRRSAMLSCNDGFRPVTFLVEALEEMFQDGRSQKVAFLAHCLLNQNAISDGTAVRPAGFPEMVSYLLEHGVGIVQLPCPELLCLGLDRGDPQGAERPVVVENTRIRRAMAQAEPSRRLAQLVEDTMTQLLEYRRYGFQVVGILGANRSPCCGVDTTSQDDQEVPGMGVFLEALSHRLEEVGWKIPMVGFRGTDDAVETVQRLLERAEHTARKEAAR